MAVYYLLFVLALLGFCYPKNIHVRNTLVFVLCILIFCRDKTVGTDVASYSANFKVMSENPGTWNFYLPFEPGFNYLVAKFKVFISQNPLNCWGAMGVLYVLAFWRFASKYTKNINVALALFILLNSYLFAFNIIRQSFALTIIMLIWASKKNTIKGEFMLSIGIILSAILFHPSMFILLVLFLYKLPILRTLFTKRNLIIIIIVSIICFYYQLIVPLLTNFLESVSIEGKLISYSTKNINAGIDSGFSLFKVLFISAFQVYVICISPKIDNFFLFMGIVGICVLNIFSPLVLEFARIYEIFVCINIIYLSQLWSTLKIYPIKNMIFKLMLLLYSTITYLNILVKNYGEIIPYQFRF